MKPFFLLLAVLASTLSLFSKTNVLNTYPAPDSCTKSALYSVEVNGKPLFVYTTKTKIGREAPAADMSFVYFDFTGTVELKITSNIKMDNAVIRPKNSNTKFSVQEKSITVKLNKAGMLVIEPNGLDYPPLAIFAGEPEDEMVSKSDTNVLYFGPGIHNIGLIKAKSGQTIYLAGGSYVNGFIIGENVSNVKVKGRGILNCSAYSRNADIQIQQKYRDDLSKNHIIYFGNSTNITIEGIICLDSPFWSNVLYRCNNVTFKNVKTFGYRANCDGLDICSSTNVIVDNCFFRNWDDCIAIKAYNGYPVKNVVIKNSVMWNDIGQALEIGYETECDTMSNIVFENIEIIRELHNCAISIHNCAQAVIKDVRIENIRVEDFDIAFNKPDISKEARVFDLYVGPSGWTSNGGTGKIKDVLIKDIFVTTVPVTLVPSSKITGHNNTYDVDNVIFDNYRVNGTKILSFEQGRFEVGLDAAKIGATDKNVKRVIFK